MSRIDDDAATCQQCHAKKQPNNHLCTIKDVIEDICGRFDVLQPLEMMEYSLFYIKDEDEMMQPLLPAEYIFDITSELDKVVSRERGTGMVISV